MRRTFCLFSNNRNLFVGFRHFYLGFILIPVCNETQRVEITKLDYKNEYKLYLKYCFGINDYKHGNSATL